MAWQLHYTSARRGPTGRSGFQFVAETPGLPDGMRARVTPHLSYRPPPEAPLSPADDELDQFPVSLLYDRVDGRPLLLRCRYLGRDYSGRYGNFFAHAVVAEPDELEGVRPVELWHAPLWSDSPASETDLPEVDELVPDEGLDPESLAAWLASGDGGDAYERLARIVDAVVAVLGRGHGRVVLVSSDIEAVARWIAVVSYSLPVAVASALSFVTYSADPDGAPQRLVGTTPDVWASAQRTSPAVLLERPVQGEDEAGRFARTVAACWRDADFAGLDALAELASSGSGMSPDAPDPAVLDRAAGLLALCRGEHGVPEDEEAGAADLLTRHGTAIPDWVWGDLVRGVPSMGYDLALAVHRWADAAGASEVARQCAARALSQAPDLTSVVRLAVDGTSRGDIVAAASGRARSGASDLPGAFAECPAGYREALLEGVLNGLLVADEPTRKAALTDAACDLLHDEMFESGTLGAFDAPLVAADVLASVGRRVPERRVAVTGRVLGLGLSVVELDPVLSAVWEDPPDAVTCLELVAAHPEGCAEHPALGVLPSRTFMRIAAGYGGLTEASTLRLAERVRTMLPGGAADADAAIVRAHADAVTSEKPVDAARALDALPRAGRLATRAFESAAERL
ncbi:GAP1-N2 domain-containing protein, partial [Actinomadura harenae]